MSLIRVDQKGLKLVEGFVFAGSGELTGVFLLEGYPSYVGIGIDSKRDLFFLPKDKIPEMIKALEAMKKYLDSNQL